MTTVARALDLVRACEAVTDDPAVAPLVADVLERAVGDEPTLRVLAALRRAGLRLTDRKQWADPLRERLGRIPVWAEPQRVGPLELRPPDPRVLVDGREVRLTPRELAVLAALAERPGRVVDTESLTLAVWGSCHVARNVLKMNVLRLRERLGERGRLIETVRGLGYRLAACDGESACPLPGRGACATCDGERP